VGADAGLHNPKDLGTSYAARDGPGFALPADRVYGIAFGRRVEALQMVENQSPRRHRGRQEAPNLIELARASGTTGSNTQMLKHSPT
jgi:hypothetical protein